VVFNEVFGCGLSTPCMVPLCSGVLADLGNGQVACVSHLASGNYSIAAVYYGDNSYVGSVSATVAQTVH
jgi:hypothetical protein